MSRRAFDRFMVDVELASNAKFARLTDREKLCVLLGVWPLAAKADPRGYLVVAGQPATAEDIAHHARCSTAIARSTLTRMRDLRMLADGEDGLERVHDWDDYNPAPRASDTPERTRERKRLSREKKRQRAGQQDTTSHADVTRDTPVTSRESHDAEVEVEREGVVDVTALASTEERGTSSAPALTSQDVHDLVAHWVDLIQPGSEVNVTRSREAAVRSRASRDDLTLDQLHNAIDGAARAAQDGVLQHEHWDTAFTSIFDNRDLTRAFIAYHDHQDDLDLLQALADTRNESA